MVVFYFEVSFPCSGRGWKYNHALDKDQMYARQRGQVVCQSINACSMSNKKGSQYVCIELLFFGDRTCSLIYMIIGNTS